MKSNLRLGFQKGDLLAIFLVALIAVCVSAAFMIRTNTTQNHVLQVYQNGELIRERPLNADYVLEIVGEYANVISVQDGRAAVIESDCPGADCVHSGWIDSPGRSIVCLPNRLELRIVGAAADVDFSVG